MKKNKKSIIVLIIASICMGIFLLNFVRIESDYFWHVKAGEYMFKNGILTHDVFSWIVNGKYWMSHEWLFEYIIYGLKDLFPMKHILVYNAIFINLLLIVIVLTNKEKYSKNMLFSLFWICLSMIFISFMQARPHLMSYTLLALSIWVLFDNYNRKDSKIIYLLPLISLVWANIHGGSSNLPYILCLIFFIAGLVSFKFKKIESDRISIKQLKKYILVFILSIISVCINIHGIKMLLYPYQNMADTTMLNNIMEWAPTNLNMPGHYVYILLVLIILIIILISNKKIRFIDLLLLGVSIFLGLKSTRFWAYTYIIMSYIVFDYIGENRYGKIVYISILSYSIVLSLFTVFNFGNIVKRINTYQLDSEMISIIKKDNPKRLFNMYDYGGELIFNDIKVFVDGRADLYSKYNFNDYLSISNLTGDYVGLINIYDFDYFLVSKDFPIYNYMIHSNQYMVLYENESYVLYKKIVN
ncbi:MAG: hypothetical protein IK137_03410 [Bacilli bacterium]|nr:hypothetical protein [Bacilli bacterium]